MLEYSPVSSTCVSLYNYIGDAIETCLCPRMAPCPRIYILHCLVSYKWCVLTWFPSSLSSIEAATNDTDCRSIWGAISKVPAGPQS